MISGSVIRQQERGDNACEVLGVLPEEQVTQLGEDLELSAGDAVSEELAVPWINDPVFPTVQNQCGCLDARLCQPPGVSCAGERLGRPGAAVCGPRLLVRH